MRFYQFVLKNVFRRRTRSALTVTGMAVAVAAVVSLVGIAEGFKKSFLSMYEERSVDLIVSRAGIFNLIQGTMPEGVAKRVREIDGVADVAPG